MQSQTRITKPIVFKPSPGDLKKWREHYEETGLHMLISEVIKVTKKLEDRQWTSQRNLDFWEHAVPPGLKNMLEGRHEHSSHEDFLPKLKNHLREPSNGTLNDSHSASLVNSFLSEGDSPSSPVVSIAPSSPASENGDPPQSSSNSAVPQADWFQLTSHLFSQQWLRNWVRKNNGSCGKYSLTSTEPSLDNTVQAESSITKEVLEYLEGIEKGKDQDQWGKPCTFSLETLPDIGKEIGKPIHGQSSLARTICLPSAPLPISKKEVGKKEEPGAASPPTTGDVPVTTEKKLVSPLAINESAVVGKSSDEQAGQGDVSREMSAQTTERAQSPIEPAPSTALPAFDNPPPPPELLDDKSQRSLYGTQTVQPSSVSVPFSEIRTNSSSAAARLGSQYKRNRHSNLGWKKRSNGKKLAEPPGKDENSSAQNPSNGPCKDDDFAAYMASLWKRPASAKSLVATFRNTSADDGNAENAIVDETPPAAPSTTSKSPAQAVFPDPTQPVSLYVDETGSVVAPMVSEPTDGRPDGDILTSIITSNENYDNEYPAPKPPPLQLRSY
ncbi:hypothetical protein QFC21_006384 [Naganishia friedmannii]|uniref:Uncharacterized protein n=1 Tax=Naganishia friedmannii TaxID=89922 RepID=A0ACC2V371_9TREE|nr:hypothetical protein QFC21_006384 [Naganishia friedmannii]